MELSELFDTQEGVSLEDPAIEISALCSNSADAVPGCLFFGMPGVNVDGARFAPDAIKRGAVAVVVSEESKVDELSMPAIRVKNPRRTLAFAAARFFAKQPETIAAVTGTAGKTSVATFLRQIWEHEGRQAASLGTTGVVAPGRDDYGNLTTPDPISLHALLAELEKGGVTHAAMEASSHGLDQSRLDGVRLSVAGFTNLGRDHLDYHPTMEEYLAAKLKLFTERLPVGAPAVVFADDEYSKAVESAAAGAGRKVLMVGRKGDFISLKKVEHEQFRQIVQLSHEGHHYRIEFPLAGDFQIANGLVAAGMAIATGSAPDQVFDALEHLKGASGRLELVERTENGSPVYVDYAHKPEALENVLSSLRPFTSGRIILVFGCGGDRDPGKRPIMGEIAARLADCVVVTDDNPRTEDASQIRAEIMAACAGAEEIADRMQAIVKGVGMLRQGDCLVIAGKGHEEGQIVGDKTLPFSDHSAVREAVSGRA